ncbi:MAG: primosomal protein [Candidatus Paceibacterota bacterium]|jgi:hypothetical protein
MKLLKEFKEFEYEVLKEDVTPDGRPGKLFVKGVIQRADTLNQNGRIYPRDILFREIENYKKAVVERRATGELDHADDPVVNLKNVSHLITDVWTEGNVVYGKIEILPTPMGNIARALIESNVKIGISSRALGSVRGQNDADVVQDDLHLICWDLVSEPSTPGAFMMREARDIDPRVLAKIFSKADRVDRVANELLGIKKGRV